MFLLNVETYLNSADDARRHRYRVTTNGKPHHGHRVLQDRQPAEAYWVQVFPELIDLHSQQGCRTWHLL